MSSESFESLYRRICGRDAPPAGCRAGPRAWETAERARRIAVFRPGLVGDLVLAVPGLRALRGRFFGAEISLIALPWAADLAERLPWIDRVLPLPVPLGDLDTVRGDRHPFLREARRHGYDLVLQLHADSPAAARFALALGGRATVGFCADDRIGRSFDLVLPMLADEPEVFRGLRLAHALGAEPAGVHLEFPLLPDDLVEIEGIPELRSLPERSLVAIHPGARPPARRWPAERFARVAAEIHRRWEASVVLVGGPEETALAERVRESSGVPALNLAGRLTLGGLAALLRRVDLFVGNDSGPAQLAAAVARRSVRIFGPANPRRWAPLDRARHRIVHRPVECSPCGYFECPIDHRCLARIQVADVMAEVDALLAGAGPPP